MKSAYISFFLFGGILSAVAQTNPLAVDKRFSRVPENAPSYQSFVIPLDGQKGIELDPLGDNAAKFDNTLPWFQRIGKDQRRHLTQNPSPGFAHLFENPLVAFGSAGGGTPLYTGQQYSFGFYGGSRAEGTPLETTNPASVLYAEVYIYAYAKSAFTAGATGVAPIQALRIRTPRRGTAEWNDFTTKGYQVEIPPVLSGLEITLKLVESTTAPANETWGAEMFSPYILTVKAASADYFFVVETIGLFQSSGGWLPTTMSPDGTQARLNRLFAFDFENRPAWRSTFIHQPHFDGEPLPPSYTGKSVEELLHAQTPVIKQLGTPLAAHSIIDASPELRRHPILDKFVADMGNDPVALANYVFNEIELTDGMAYSDAGNISDAAIYPGGVNRGALATFLEGQGSPVEQCSLLVYLLRQAGYPAVYVFPPRNELKMLDLRMSRLLRMQFRGLVNNLGVETLPGTIPVNYPWVSVYVPDAEHPGQSKWVHVFPWMKDTEIVEGQELYSLMPAGYRTGYQWMRKYLDKDNTILSLSSESDSVGELFGTFLEKSLRDTHPEFSIDDVGVKARNRRHYFTRWDDFPQPWEVTETNGTMTVQSDLSATPDIFDTVEVDVWSDRNSNGLWDSGEPRIQTGPMRSLDVHNRRMLLSYQQTTGDNHNMILTMAPYRPGTTGTGTFGSSDPTWLSKQQASVVLGSTDYNIKLKVTHKRTRSLGTSFNPGDRWSNPFGFSSWVYGTRTVENVSDLSKGDLAAVCLNFGRVSQRMLSVHLEAFWAEEQRLKETPGATGDPEVMQGTAAYIMGMSYYEKVSRFQEQLKDLHKVNVISTFANGLAKLGARRNADGTLINSGQIDLVYPVVDMSFSWLAYAGNGTARPDLQGPRVLSMDDFIVVAGGDVSSQEHRSINDYFEQFDAVSTVKLIHLAKQAGQTIIELNTGNYAAQGEVNYTHNGTTKKLKDWCGTGVWGKIAEGFGANAIWKDYQRVLITPGPVSGAGGTYRGVGAFIMQPEGFSALITPNINGGYGRPVAYNSFQSSNFSNISLTLGQNFTPRISVSPPSFSAPIITPSISTNWNISSTYNSIASGYSVVSSFQSSSWNSAASALNYTPTGTLAQINASLYRYTANTGWAGGSSYKGNFWSEVGQAVSDPVNSITGEFYVDAVDIRLEGPMPLEIRRNYSSLNKASNEFGYGWKWGYFPYLMVASDEDVIHAAEMDGSVIVYKKQSADVWKPTIEKNPDWVNVNGQSMGSTGNLFNATITRSTSGGQTYFTLQGPDGSERVFHVRSFPTAGTNGITRQRPYLETWSDSRGNSYNFAFETDSTRPGYGQVTRVQSTNGNFLGFYYDTFGHIKEAYTGDGRRLYYRYDKYGDLIEVTRPDASVITYDYGRTTETVGTAQEAVSTHLITRETKPGGRILENDYDTDRRVKEQRATVGDNLVPVRNATFIYSGQTTETDGSKTGYTLVRDAYNREGRYDYVRSQLTRVLDPLGQQTAQVWYDPTDTSPGAYPRALKRRTDKRGLISDFSYDTAGNLKAATYTGDLTGDGISDTATTSFHYNALNLVDEMIDPVLNRTVTRYENPAYPYLPTTIERHAPGGLISTTRRVYRNETSTAASAYGLLESETTAFGSPDAATESFLYSPAGFPLTRTRETGTSDPAIVTNYRYNLRGELIEERDAIGRAVGYAYDAMGRRIWTESHNESGALVGWQYDYFDGNGEMTWSDGMRYNPEDYTWRKFDGAGRIREEIRWRSRANGSGDGVLAPVGDDLYSTTFHRYNLFGSLLESRLPDRSLVEMDHDAIGRMKLRTVKENGVMLSSESWTYEPGDQIETYNSPLGGITTFTYTAAGQPKTRSNPDGSFLEWRYQLDGRPVREPISHSTYWDIAYDDLARTVTRTLRSNGGGTLGGEAKAFDRRGNCISRTDLDGNTFETTFDHLNRPKTSNGPASTASSAQQSTTWTYDSCGKTTTIANGLGEKTITETDILGRTVSVVIRDAADSLVRQTRYEYSPDHNKVTKTEGTGSDAVATRTWSDTFGKPVIVRHADESKRIMTYDVAGRLTESKDELGHTTGFLNNALGQVTQQTLPDGAVVKFDFDPIGNMKSRLMPGGMEWKATYDAAGRITGESLVNGAQSTRAFGYSYYPSGAQTGLLQTLTDPRGLTRTTLYDAFRRPETVTASGPGVAHNVGVTYGYDNRGNPTAITRTGGDQPSSVVARVIDGYGQLTSETVTLGGQAHSTIAQTWNAAGRRTEMNGGTMSSTFGHNAAGQTTAVFSGAHSSNFGYTTAGLLDSRTNTMRSQSVTARDARKRMTGWATTANGSVILSESLIWRDDSTLSDYTAARLGTHAWNESRAYGYNSRGKLLSETYAPWSGASATLNYEFDSGTSGVGVRTQAKVGIGGNTNWFLNAATVNPLARVTSETDNTVLRQTTAQGASMGAAGVRLDVDGVPYGEATHPGWADATGAWSRALDLPPGQHQLSAYAVHPSGWVTDPAQSTFTLTGQPQTLDTGYDAAGNVTTRTWSGGKVQTLTWDADNRLVKVVQSGGSETAFTWTAAYDGLGRRLLTTNTPSGGSAFSIRSTYDPQVTHLEVGVRTEGTAGTVDFWKVYGPDLNGAYGGLQGAGGLDAVISNGVVTVMTADAFGNAVASVTPAGVVWSSAKLGGYGPLPTSKMETLESGASLIAATAWRGARIDPAGFIQLGVRPYDPEGGRFLAADPLGHGASMSLYCFSDGDPVNFYDPDGNLTVGAWNLTTKVLGNPYVSGSLRTVGGVAEAGAGVAFGTASSWTGVGAVAGGAVAMHGIDQAVAGIRTISSGQHQSSFTSMGIQRTGISQPYADLIDSGISIAGTGALGLASRSSSVAPVASAPRSLPAALPAAKSVTAPFKSGEIITREFASSGGPVEMAAEAVINGRMLHLKDIAVFPKGAEQLNIGMKEVLRLRGQLADEVAGMGFDTLRITGTRLTGANPGKAVDMTIDLTKRAAGQ